MSKKEEIWKLRNELGTIKEILCTCRKTAKHTMKTIYKLSKRRREVKSKLRQLGGRAAPFK